MRRNGAFKLTATVRSNDSASVSSMSPRAIDSRIIDEAVDSSKVRDRFRDEFRGTCGSSSAPMTKDACFSDFGSQFLRCISPSSMDHDLRAFAGKEPHHGLPDAGGRAGHQDYFVLQAYGGRWLMAGALL